MQVDERIDHIWDLLKTIPDPEVPALTVVELGVIREVKFDQERIVITITPTYSGCPAMNFFEDEIEKVLSTAGYNDVKLSTVYEPAWTTDWLSNEAKKKLKDYGIAPPVGSTNDKGVLSIHGPKVVPCPQCNSQETELISQFGSTACKALYKCLSCLEPFEYFKCI
ncbi:MAG: phenylacetate-CoA oxygenase subunit PaaJ [Flavobacteriales bacterium]|nr:phenylacetate-CoA oxygenase subunit PaaJ [Flavobacteriales bacterium]